MFLTHRDPAVLPFALCLRCNYVIVRRSFCLVWSHQVAASSFLLYILTMMRHGGTLQGIVGTEDEIYLACAIDQADMIEAIEIDGEGNGGSN